MNKYEFDETYFDDKVTNWWIYPPEQGYVLDRNKQPIKHKITLRVGKRMDRYGGEGGNFLWTPAVSHRGSNNAAVASSTKSSVATSMTVRIRSASPTSTRTAP